MQPLARIVPGPGVADGLLAVGAGRVMPLDRNTLAATAEPFVDFTATAEHDDGWVVSESRSGPSPPGVGARVSPVAIGRSLIEQAGEPYRLDRGRARGAGLGRVVSRRLGRSAARLQEPPAFARGDLDRRRHPVPMAGVRRDGWS